MLRKAGWAIGIVFLVSHVAAGQEPEPPEKLPLPVTPGVKKEGAAPVLDPIIQIEGSRSNSLVYADADYLFWWCNHGPAPVLLTTAPNNGLNPNGLTGGILGQPGTTTLFTGRDIEYRAFSALRAKAGISLDAEGFWFFEVGGFFLPKQSFQFSMAGGGNGAPLLVIPFLDAATGQPSSLDISSQDAAGNPYLTGTINIHSDINVWGYEFNAIAHSIRTADRYIHMLVGFRAMGLSENLTIRQTVIPAQDGNLTLQFPTVGTGGNSYFDVVGNTPVSIIDSFSARNQFLGGQIGGRFGWDLGRLTAELSAKVAFGVTHQQVTIDGSTTAASAINPNGNAVVNNLTTPGGVFALSSNSGSYSQNQFTVAPEIGVNLKYALASWLHVRFGYSAMYWSNVARPGAQIDPVLNSKLVPTGALLPTNTNPPGAFVPGQEQGRPFFVFRDTSFWAQGINAGVEFRY